MKIIPWVIKLDEFLRKGCFGPVMAGRTTREQIEEEFGEPDDYYPAKRKLVASCAPIWQYACVEFVFAADLVQAIHWHSENLRSPVVCSAFVLIVPAAFEGSQTWTEIAMFLVNARIPFSASRDNLDRPVITTQAGVELLFDLSSEKPDVPVLEVINSHSL